MHASYTIATPRAATPSTVRPTHDTYARRRLVALVFVATSVLSLGLFARHALADRGDGAASVTTSDRPSLRAVPGLLPDGTYVVQPGDSMWTIASRVHGGESLSAYVDAMVAVHGGVTIVPGERLRLP